jgi:hypothetical protein
MSDHKIIVELDVELLENIDTGLWAFQVRYRGTILGRQYPFKSKDEAHAAAIIFLEESGGTIHQIGPLEKIDGSLQNGN